MCWRILEPERRSVKWTFIIIGVAVAAYIAQNMTDMWVYFAFFPAFALENPWMFVTSIFLHSSIDHIFFNMLALFFFGMYTERMLGSRLFLAIFFTAGIAGNAGYYFTASDPLIPAIGASGAIYGLMGVLAVLTPRLMVFIYGFLPLPMVAAAAVYAVLDFTGLFGSTGIAHGAHLGGLVVGIVIALLIKRRYRIMSNW